MPLPNRGRCRRQPGPLGVSSGRRVARRRSAAPARQPQRSTLTEAEAFLNGAEVHGPPGGSRRRLHTAFRGAVVPAMCCRSSPARRLLEVIGHRQVELLFEDVGVEYSLTSSNLTGSGLVRPSQSRIETAGRSGGCDSSPGARASFFLQQRLPPWRLNQRDLSPQCRLPARRNIARPVRRNVQAWIGGQAASFLGGDGCRARSPGSGPLAVVRFEPAASLPRSSTLPRTSFFRATEADGIAAVDLDGDALLAGDQPIHFSMLGCRPASSRSSGPPRGRFPRRVPARSR